MLISKSRLIAYAAFLVGLLLGFGFSAFLTLLGWLAVGLAVALGADALAGLGGRACSARAWLRDHAAALWSRHTSEPEAEVELQLAAHELRVLQAELAQIRSELAAMRTLH